MPKTTYTVPEVAGSKRTSERPYTHAIIGYADSERIVRTWRTERKENAAKTARWEAQTYKANQRAAAATVGQHYINHNNYSVVARDYEVKSGQEFIAKYPTLEDYLKKTDADFEKQCETELARGNGPVVVLRWSASLANATKGLSEFQRAYSGVKIVECVPVEKKAKK